MTQKDHKKLRREELLEILVEQGRQIDSLKRQLEEKSNPEDDRALTIEQEETGETDVALMDTAALKRELEQEKNKSTFLKVLRNTVFSLITVAAVAVLVATLVLPVLKIYGSSMTPSLSQGNIVVSVKDNSPKRGDVLSFYYNNKILVKRVIAFAGEWVDIDEDGNVSVNGEPLEETYLTEKALGECDISLPYQVPDGKIFVMGDHRATSVDSRSTTVGCVSEEQIVGKIIFRVWPISSFGPIQ